jgi:hypothetical protein
MFHDSKKRTFECKKRKKKKGNICVLPGFEQATSGLQRTHDPIADRITPPQLACK